METMTNKDAYSLYTQAHSGWSKSEDTQLFEEVKHAREEGRPLKSAFDRMARITGRKSNSIRNYYYIRIRDEDIATLYESYVGQTAAFVPFTDGEVREMLKKLLVDQAKGMSVRASTMELGHGDTTSMLRYQNKYRSVIKSNREIVESVLDELARSGIHAFNPYTDKPAKKLGRPKKTEVQNEQLVDIMAETVSELGNVEGLDVSALFESIGALAMSAGKGAVAIRQLEQIKNSGEIDVILLRDENEALKNKIKTNERELANQKDRIVSLLSAFRMLVHVNTDFLEMTGVAKVSSLGNYIRELSRIISDCNRIVTET